MKEIWRNSIYQAKNIFRDISFTFWGIMYPIVLVSFFHIAFSGITSLEIETINVGIENGNEISYILEDIEILNIVEVSEKDIEKKLKSEKIDAYVKEDLNLIVDRSGLDQTIVKGILDQINQTIALNEPIENLDFSINYLVENTQEANGVLVIFYSLIAMVSTYGIFAGIEMASLSQANLSNIAARINVTPIRKSTLIISGVGVGLLINIFSNIVLLLYMKFVLQLDLFTNIPYSILFILLGNIFGISLGVFIGVSNKMDWGVKTMMAIVSTLILSFFAGLMSVDIKVLIDKNLPILSKVNPIAIITNSLYRINLLNNTSNLAGGIFLLAIQSFILMSASYLFLRRRKYDSI